MGKAWETYLRLFDLPSLLLDRSSLLAGLKDGGMEAIRQRSLKKGTQSFLA